jgi:quinone-modifying oxidoreductase, subunit QmoC
MAAMRRYLIAEYDPSGLAGLMFRSPAFTISFTLLLAVLLGCFHLCIHSGKRAVGRATPFPAHWAPFSWIPYETIHLIGIVVGALVMLLVLTGLFNAARMMLKPHGGLAALRRRKAAGLCRAFVKLGREIATMQRHGQCGAGAQPAEPWYLRPRFAHGMILAGFVALLMATMLDFLFVFALKMQFYGIARPVGVIGGVAMLYGLLVYAWKRTRRATPNTKTTTLADAWLLSFLLVLDLTGFALLVVTGAGWKGAASDVILLLHSVMAMEIVLLFPLTKAAHALYRPLALFLHFLTDPQAEA